MAAMSALRSRAGPEVVEMLTPISSAMMLARVVLPSPGGPARSTWSRGSPRDRAAAMKMPAAHEVPAAPRKS
jgi:hypothetical protein